jgi:hypothetical protein
MSADHSVHASDEVVVTHDLAAEAEHARHHAVANNWFFLCFFSLVGIAVLFYEFTANGPWTILLLGAARFTLIGIFLFSLTRQFSLVVRTLAFTIFFLGGMIYLSMWSSTLKSVGDPITIVTAPTHH